MKFAMRVTAMRARFCLEMLVVIGCTVVSGVPVMRRQMPPIPSAPAGEGLGAARTIQSRVGPVDPAALEYAAQHSAKSLPDASHSNTLPHPLGTSPDLQVVVPAEAVRGSKLLVNAPDGQQLQVTVPPAAVPGQTILVHIPPSPPLTKSLQPPSPIAAIPASDSAPSSSSDPASGVPTSASNLATVSQKLAGTPVSLPSQPSPNQLPTTLATGDTSIPPVTILNRDISHITPDTEDAAGWEPVPCPAGHLNLDCTIPTMKTWELHTSNDGTMLSGIWEATPGTYHATFRAYEFVHMIYGRIVITPDDGSGSFTVQGGDTFVVEANFKGLWKIEQAVRKYFDYRCIDDNCT